MCEFVVYMIIEASLQARKVFRVVFFFLNPHVSLTFTGEESFCQDQKLTLLSSQEGRKEGRKEGWMAGRVLSPQTRSQSLDKKGKKTCHPVKVKRKEINSAA